MMYSSYVIFSNTEYFRIFFKVYKAKLLKHKKINKNYNSFTTKKAF